MIKYKTISWLLWVEHLIYQEFKRFSLLKSCISIFTILLSATSEQKLQFTEEKSLKRLFQKLWRLFSRYRKRKWERQSNPNLLMNSNPWSSSNSDLIRWILDKASQCLEQQQCAGSEKRRDAKEPRGIPQIQSIRTSNHSVSNADSFDSY